MSHASPGRWLPLSGIEVVGRDFRVACTMPLSFLPAFWVLTTMGCQDPWAIFPVYCGCPATSTSQDPIVLYTPRVMELEPGDLRGQQAPLKIGSERGRGWGLGSGSA